MKKCSRQWFSWYYITAAIKQCYHDHPLGGGAALGDKASDQHQTQLVRMEDWSELDENNSVWDEVETCGRGRDAAGYGNPFVSPRALIIIVQFTAFCLLLFSWRDSDTSRWESRGLGVRNDRLTVSMPVWIGETASKWWLGHSDREMGSKWQRERDQSDDLVTERWDQSDDSVVKVT